MTAQILYPILYLEINLTAALLILFIRFKTLGISRMVSQRNFSFAIDAEIVFFLSDTVAVLILWGPIPFSRAGLIASKSVYFFSTALMCFSGSSPSNTCRGRASSRPANWSCYPPAWCG